MPDPNEDQEAVHERYVLTRAHVFWHQTTSPGVAAGQGAAYSPRQMEEARSIIEELTALGNGLVKQRDALRRRAQDVTGTVEQLEPRILVAEAATHERDAALQELVTRLDQVHRGHQVVEAAAARALGERDALLRQIAEMPPMVEDSDGFKLCRFGCGYDGDPLKAHRPGCLWLQARELVGAQ